MRCCVTKPAGLCLLFLSETEGAATRRDAPMVFPCILQLGVFVFPSPGHLPTGSFKSTVVCTLHCGCDNTCMTCTNVSLNGTYMYELKMSHTS